MYTAYGYLLLCVSGVNGVKETVYAMLFSCFVYL